jgi:outer membrane biosynthesis protein TonB
MKAKIMTNYYDEITITKNVTTTKKKEFGCVGKDDYDEPPRKQIKIVKPKVEESESESESEDEEKVPRKKVVPKPKPKAKPKPKPKVEESDESESESEDDEPVNKSTKKLKKSIDSVVDEMLALI